MERLSLTAIEPLLVMIWETSEDYAFLLCHIKQHSDQTWNINFWYLVKKKKRSSFTEGERACERCIILLVAAVFVWTFKTTLSEFICCSECLSVLFFRSDLSPWQQASPGSCTVHNSHSLLHCSSFRVSIYLENIELTLRNSYSTCV